MRKPVPATRSGPSDPSDSELIARVIAQRDHYAFSELVKRHQSMLRASLRKMTSGHIELADDIAQETFILAWKNIQKFRYEAKFSTWLYRIAFNAWQTEVRKRAEITLDADAMPEGEPLEPESNAIGLRRDLAQAMVDLSDIERAAIHQCFYNDLSHEEAAYVLKVPLGTLKTHILRAREKMRHRLAEYVIDGEHRDKQGVAA